MTAAVIPLLIASAAIWGLYRKVDVFSAMTSGARYGLGVALRLLPVLVILLTAISMLRASGFLDDLTGWIQPALSRLGIPAEVAPLMILRPFSGSGALALGGELFTRYGPDSVVGRTAAIVLGASETTFYVIGIYLPAAGVKRARYIIPAALTGDFAAFVMAAWMARAMG
jgi:spore maturation protein B